MLEFNDFLNLPCQSLKNLINFNYWEVLLSCTTENLITPPNPNFSQGNKVDWAYNSLSDYSNR